MKLTSVVTPGHGHHRQWICALGLVALTAVGCANEGRAEPLRTALPDITVMGNAPSEAGDRPPRRQERRKKKRYRDAPTYLDGKFQGMMKFSELPPKLPTLIRALEDGRKVLRFAWTDYVTALGADLAKVKTVHLYGGRDIICIVSGDELRRTKGKFRFSFTRGRSGLPRLELPPDGIKYNTYVDKVRGVAIYQDKEPPVYREDKLYMPGGQLVARNVFPYTDGERHGGTRVYLDGVYKAAFKRRNLKAELLVTAGKPADGYAMNKAMASFGLPLAGLSQVQIFGKKDDLLLDLNAANAGNLGKLSFTLPQHNRGRIVAKLQPEQTDPAALESILLYRNTRPPDRKLPTP